MQQASYLEGGPLLWIWPLYLHVTQKSDDDDDDDDDDDVKFQLFVLTEGQYYRIDAKKNTQFKLVIRFEIIS